VWCHANEKWPPMDSVTLETTIKAHLKEMRERLDDAANLINRMS